MHWRRKPAKKRPNVGDTRTRIKFLWLPIISGLDVYWLEKVRLVEQYYRQDWYYEASEYFWAIKHVERLL